MPKVVQHEEQKLIFPNEHHEYIQNDDGSWRPEEGVGPTPEEAHENLLKTIEAQQALDKEEKERSA